MPFNSSILWGRANGDTLLDDRGQTLVYDAWNRLIAVNNTAGTLIASYSYDGMGRRVVQSTPGANPIVMFYDSNWQLLEQDVSASGLTLQGQYVWSAGAGYPDALVLRDFAFAGGGFNLKERIYALQDANWNVTALVTYSTLTGDADGNGSVDFSDLGRLLTNYNHTMAGGDAVGDFDHNGVVDQTDLNIILANYNTSSTSSSWIVAERFAYSPYGVMTPLNPDFTVESSGDYLAWNVGFQGMLVDSTTELNFTMTRVYEASTGRFLTVDPARADGMNWYRGFADNPINSTDPSGTIRVRTLSKASFPHGGFDVTWNFYLDAPAKSDGYIVQEVTQTQILIKNGVTKMNFGTDPVKGVVVRYWEAWRVKCGTNFAEALPAEHQHGAFTDEARRPAMQPDGYWGYALQTGVIKFYLVKTVGELGDQTLHAFDATVPIVGSVNDSNFGFGRSYGTGLGAPVSPGLLSSTAAKPTWWNKPSDDGETTGNRSASITWNDNPDPKLGPQNVAGTLRVSP